MQARYGNSNDRKLKPEEVRSSLSKLLLEAAQREASYALEFMESSISGLTDEEAKNRLEKYGYNEIAQNKPPVWWMQLFSTFKNPFIVVLMVLDLVSYLTRDVISASIVSVMIAISVLLRFGQEFRSQKAVEKLKAMVSTSTTVSRAGHAALTHPLSFDSSQNGVALRRKLAVQELVPGDIIHLSAGDLIPADVRLIASKDLLVSQSALTGESMMSEKSADSLVPPEGVNPLEMETICFMGTNVISGSATALVVNTGSRTVFGTLAHSVLKHQPKTSFDIGVNSVSMLLVRFMFVMAPIVFLINGLVKKDWTESFFFALAIAVGLTPEMLPLIVTTNLAKGAMAMSKKKVIVKHLSSIQNFGAMDILCTDKTGTLTEDQVALVEHLNIHGEESEHILSLAFLNSYHQTGLNNLIDKAVVTHMLEYHAPEEEMLWQKMDELPFDFTRRRMSVIVSHDDRSDRLICKGAVEEIIRCCTYAEVYGQAVTITPDITHQFTRLSRSLHEEGMRVIAVAYRDFPHSDAPYSVDDESDLILTGFIGFLDPPKPSSAKAIQALHDKGVQIKILTGDNERITQKIGREIGFPVDRLLLGHELDAMSDEELSEKAEEIHLFAKMNPLQKARVIHLLRKNGHTVGYLGDGINDAAALKEADVGISVDTAVDIAKESADMILLEKDLQVLDDGVHEGRLTFGNIMKYIKMTASSNFRNAFSVLVASAFIPFLPMLAIHLLIQNLMYELNQLTIPWDRMDADFLKRPRKWEAKGIARFMLLIGPISSIFDISTYFLLWFVFSANSPNMQALFQSGWFIEGLLSQTLIVHMIRTQKVPFLQSTATWPVLASSLIVMVAGLMLPFTALGAYVGMVPLPLSYFPWLLTTLFCYCILTQFVKVWYIRKFHSWL